jgi:hypothetical protein
MEYTLAHTVIKSKEIRYMGHAVHKRKIKLNVKCRLKNTERDWRSL